MKILAIETSCDDTGVAVLEEKNKHLKPLSNVVSSQTIHQQYGGVFPMMAKREHQKSLVPVLTSSLVQAKLLKKKRKPTIEEKKLQTLKKILEKEQNLYESFITFLHAHEKPAIDAIAVTYGPGLEPCLWVGVNFARALSFVWNIPIIPVNHIEAHILVNFLDNQKISFPAVALVVSGGHTQLILVKGIGKYKIIGETRDDAAGECFDKAAKILGLGYPGGPIVSKIVSQWKAQTQNSKFQIPNSKALPRPMMHSKDYDFSFSGLKTAVLYETKGKSLTKEYVAEMCYETQQAILDVLIKKTVQAAKDYKVKTVILGGGVSANQELRKQLKERTEKEIPKTQYIIPDASLSTDNGLMIAVAGYFHRTKKIAWQRLKANANLRISK